MMDYQVAESNIHTAAIGCFKALMNNSVSQQNCKYTNVYYKYKRLCLTK